MENPHPITMTPEQLAAVQSGHGVAHLQDPNTQRVYLLIEQGQQPTLSEDYFREKLGEGIAESDRGESKAWDVSKLKDGLRRRYTRRLSIVLPITRRRDRADSRSTRHT